MDRTADLAALSSIFADDFAAVSTRDVRVTLRLRGPVSLLLSEGGHTAIVQFLPPVTAAFRLTKSKAPLTLSSEHDWLAPEAVQRATAAQQAVQGKSLFESVLAVKETLEAEVAASPVLCPTAAMFAALVGYNETMRAKEFALLTYTCSVCFDEKPGTQMLRLSGCTDESHVHCNECARAYFISQIDSGAVDSLRCLSAGCKTLAQPTEVARILGDRALYERYETLLFDRALQGMRDVVYCPRQQCQKPVLFDKAKQGTLAICYCCTETGYAFCIDCNKSYHGLSKCAVLREGLLKFVREYASGTPQRRLELEAELGKEFFVKYATAVELELNLEYMKSIGKCCPTCKTGVEKLSGCNRMTCLLCKTNFCWTCGIALNPLNPYGHFSNNTTGCTTF
eukprot:TRINITY_DN8269_c0_g1_i2.p1 TRINITY_DN8269_c0_g1~~TRINITY_DN8269_c0_g1_i2.p1  ORF type:complete len:396 (+),score=81.60 TRINITY_DN8269_c0_g1_i2:91-1278(+)